MLIKLFLLQLLLCSIATIKTENQGPKKQKRNLALLIGQPIPINRIERRILNLAPHRHETYPSPFFPKKFHPAIAPIRFEPVIQYSQADPLYESDSSSLKYVKNDISPDSVYDHGPDNEPIIEIIIKESNESLSVPQTPIWAPSSGVTPKNNIKVFYVPYQKNPHGSGKNSVIYGKPVPALTPIEYHQTDGEETATETPSPTTKRITTTLRAIIKPDSEQHLLTSKNLKITFGDSKYDAEGDWSDNDRTVLQESSPSFAYVQRPPQAIYNFRPPIAPPKYRQQPITSFRDLFRKQQPPPPTQQFAPQFFFGAPQRPAPLFQQRIPKPFLTPPPQQDILQNPIQIRAPQQFQRLPQLHYINFHELPTPISTTTTTTIVTPTLQHQANININAEHGQIYKSLPKYEQHLIYDQRDATGKIVNPQYTGFFQNPLTETNHGFNQYYNKYYSSTSYPSSTTTTTTTTSTTPAPPVTTTMKADAEKIRQNSQKLPDEVPEDLRQQLLSSGVLENADITVLDYDKIGSIPIEKLPPDQLATFLSAGGGQQIAEAGSDPIPDQVEPEAARKSDKIEMKVVRFDPTKDDMTSKYIDPDAEKMSPVRLNDQQYNRYLPLNINGTHFPIPDELADRNISSVVILAPVDYRFQPITKRDAKTQQHIIVKRGIQIGSYLGKVILDPSEENFQKWLQVEKMATKKSIVFLLTKNKDTNENEIYKYDVDTMHVNLADDELSQQYVNVAFSNKIKRNPQ